MADSVDSVDYFSTAQPADQHVVAAALVEPGPDDRPRVRLLLLSQGEFAQVAHQLSPRSEPFRLLLRKEASVAAPPACRAPAALERFTLTVGCRVVLAPCREPRSSRFTQTVELAAVASSLDEALRLANALGCPALVCEVARAGDDRGGAVEWIRWDGGQLVRPP